MYTSETIIKSLNYRNNNKTYRDIASIMDISKSTIHKWCYIFNKDHTKFCDRIARRKKRIIKQNNDINRNNIINIVLQLLKKNSRYTRKEIISILDSKHNIKISYSKLIKLFKIANITRKKIKKIVCKDKNFIENLSNKRKEYINNISNIPNNKIISIDESGFNNINNDYGYSIKGTKIHEPVKQLRQKNISLLMAITEEEILKFELHENSINSDIFYEFIKNIIDNLNENGYYFLFDNAPIHKSKKIKSLITESGNFIIDLPSYSPNNNPIENVFSLIKHNYKKNIFEESLNISHSRRKDIIRISITNIFNIEVFKRCFRRAFEFSYVDIETELIDRIMIID